MNILFVCTGNTCRSPMAEGYLRSRKLNNINVTSRGLASDGSPVSKCSVEVMGEIGIDISSHLSKQLTHEDIEASDKIISLSLSHKELLLSVGVDEKKLFVLGHGISDPFGGDSSVYRKSRDEIIEEIDKLINSGFFTSFEIRSLKPGNIPQIAQLEKICFSEPWSENGILEAYKNGTKFFVAEKSGSLLGYIGIKSVIDEGYITNVAVFPQYRNQGIASALIGRVFELAEEKALAFASLEVRVSNFEAVALYEKLGFITEGRRKNFYRSPTEDALIMTRRFDFQNEDSRN